MRGNGTERKTGQAIKSEVLFRKEKQKTVSSTWAVEGERKKKKRKKETSHKPLLASCTFRGQERRAETMVASTQVILKGIV